ncbi:MAG: hypothetical protein PHW24_02170 [Candidatus Moranbacteria bacterium]|nr:hypothetical protein [Candidatus Moranbacteria bacterium]
MDINTTILLVGGVLLIIIVFLMVNLFTMPLNDFLEKMVKKTLWLWLPIHALKRLSREFKDKYLK